MRREFTILLVAVALVLVFVYAQKSFVNSDAPTEGVYFSPDDAKLFPMSDTVWFFVILIALVAMLFFFWTLRQYQRKKAER